VGLVGSSSSIRMMYSSASSFWPWPRSRSLNSASYQTRALVDSLWRLPTWRGADAPVRHQAGYGLARGC
jgi:hypothetical protein